MDWASTRDIFFSFEIEHENRKIPKPENLKGYHLILISVKQWLHGSRWVCYFHFFQFIFCFSCLISLYTLIFLRWEPSKMIVIVVLFIKHDTLNQIFVIFVNFLICVKYFMNFSVFLSYWFMLYILQSIFHLVNWMVQVRNSTTILTKEFIDALPNGWTDYAWRRINKGILL